MQDILSYIAETVQNLPHCKKLGLEITRLNQGSGATMLRPNPAFIGNPKRLFFHSAIATTVLDTLCGAVASSAYDGGRTVATLDLRLDHLTTMAGDKPLYGQAECFHKNDDVAYVRGWAWQDNPDEPVAKATGTFMVNGPFQLIVQKDPS
ncbi:MAG: PaaI family thioesterase [Methylocystaceae bacterium]|nr:PaaI family thioesterase [Methylocystaceae bacterium]